MAEKKRYETIAVEKEEGGLWITLNRPHRLNAMTLEMCDEILSAIEEAEADKEVRCVVFTGAGDRAFSVGADLTTFAGVTMMGAVDASAKGHDLMGKIESMPKPTIAAINGFCLGGGLEFASACDFRIAAEHAELGQPEIRLGLIPGWGGTQRLAKLVGLAKAKEFIMVGDRVPAQEALRLGLVHKVVPTQKFKEEVKSFAKKLVEGPPIALGLAKRALNFGTQVPLDVGLKVESQAFGMVAATKDVIEGVSAFMEKRKPEFKGE